MININKNLTEAQKRHLYRKRIRFIRKTSDPFNIPRNEFKRNYRYTFSFIKRIYLLLLQLNNFLLITYLVFCRLSQELAKKLYKIIKYKIRSGRSISKKMKLLITLNYLGTGSYEFMVGQNHLHPVSQPSVSRCIDEIVDILEELAPRYIYFPSTPEERKTISRQ